jgi:hypothetical protein
MNSSRYVRRAAAGLASIAVAAAAITFVAKRAPDRDTRTASAVINVKKKGDADAFKPGRNAETAVGANERRSPDDTVEVEKAAIRNYPAEDTPFEATLNAQQAFASIAARSNSKNAAGVWQLIGPSRATYPSVLNVIGDGDQYVTAGRVTAMAIGPSCSTASCPLYVAAAGGGIWRTNQALSGSPGWEFVSGNFLTNAMGSLIVDPTDPTGKTLFAGTGEPNVSADSEAGMGIYKSTDGGTTWAQLPAAISGGFTFNGRAIASIAIAPDHSILVGVARAIRGYSSVPGGPTSNPPPTTLPAPFGLYRSMDGGASFTQIWNGAGSVRGVNHVEIDPSNPNVIYAAALGVGVWRSTNNGGMFTQIKTPLNAAYNFDRAEFSVVALPNGKTRMYVGVGNQADPPARFYRTDDAVLATNASFVDLTTAQVINYCTGQCWYDNVVYSPAGHPDVVYVMGSYDYTQRFANGISNGRSVLLSTDAGVTWSDVTWDADPHHSEAIHPDQHAIVVNPNNPFQFFSGSDGGVVRSDGTLVDDSAKCDQRNLSPANNAYCKSLLWRVPKQLYSLNEGFSTLQYQSLSVSTQRPQNNLQGGTQDNGTYQYTGSDKVAWMEMYGDGGQSGFNVADDALRFNTFTGQFNDVNFRNGDPTKWCVATGAIVSSPEASYFYPPITADPHPMRAGTIFQGSFSVWRTQDWGGDREYLETNCPEFTTSGANTACGDFVRIGPPGLTDLGGAAYGTRAGGAVAAIERAPSNMGTVWAATGTGRVFISDNADDPASSVVWERIDDKGSTTDPARFPTSIYVDPQNHHHAWISYSGYNFNTPAQPGHVFEVTWNGATATWTNLDGGTGPMGDLPVTDLVRDDLTGDLYAATDFGVLRQAASTTTWVLAGTGMPKVEVPGLTIVPGARLLYAATHGRSAWVLQLP